MQIKKQINRIIKTLNGLINNPNLYVAAVVGAVVGGLTGGAVGLLSGGFIGYAFKLCNGCMTPIYDINPDIIVGGIVGHVIGTIVGGGITALVSMYKIYKKTQQIPHISSESITPILLRSIFISLEMAIGMGLGAVIGSLKLPGVGSVIGAVIGVGLILFTSTWEQKPL
jgi:hypothetical protein